LDLEAITHGPAKKLGDVAQSLLTPLIAKLLD
jgi:hypothetical protein